MPELEPDAPVMLYDGMCNLCTSSVGFVLRHDRQGKFRFAALQSETGRRLLDGCPSPPADLSTVVLLLAGRCFERSTAVLRILRLLPWPWSALSLFRIVPRALRDGVYRFVARVRTRWFGRRAVCMTSLHGFEDRFLQ